MISMKDYLGPWANSADLTPARQANAQRLLSQVNSLMAVAMQDGVTFKVNPKTKNQISGEKYGGFRPQGCPEGSPKSAHKEGLAVDLYDPDGKIDEWLLKSPRAQQAIASLGLYFETGSATPGWSHWTIRPPASGRRFFNP